MFEKKKKMFKEAFGKYLTELNSDPWNLEVIIGLLNCYLGLGDNENALTVSEQLKPTPIIPSSSKLMLSALLTQVISKKPGL